MAGPGTAPRRPTDAAPARCLAGGIRLPPALRPRLLLDAPAQPLPPPCRHWPEGGPDCAPGGHQPPNRFPPAGRLVQGGDPNGPAPPGRAPLRQAAAALRRPDRRVPPAAPRGQPLRHPRLYPPYLGRARFPRRPVPLPQEVWPPAPHACKPAGRRATGRGARAALGLRGRRTPRPAGPRTGAPLFWAHTQYAGAFLLLPRALSWLATARGCFRDEAGGLQRGLLTSVFALVVGLPRIFHLDEMEDVGFAVLTGGRRCPSRHSVGGWRRHLCWYEVDAFCRRTAPWHLLHRQDAVLSFDEHTIPRWTRKFHIRKGYVTTRNKYMRCEKLFYTYDVFTDRYLAAADPRLDVTVRASRYPHRLRQWKQLPSGLFTVLEEPGACVGAPPKELRLAETLTVLKDESPKQAIRTLVCREVVPGPKKDRWHPLYTTSAGCPADVLPVFRARQHHEQAYRVGVYDEFLDAVPCGYDKHSPDRQRPRFHRGPLQMIGWLVALVYNAVADLAAGLAKDHTGAFVSTLRRQFFNRPGRLYCTPEALLVYLDPFGGQEALEPVVDRFNAAGHRLPWLDGRRIVISLTPRRPPEAGP